MEKSPALKYQIGVLFSSEKSIKREEKTKIKVPAPISKNV